MPRFVRWVTWRVRRWPLKPLDSLTGRTVGPNARVWRQSPSWLPLRCVPARSALVVAHAPIEERGERGLLEALIVGVPLAAGFATLHSGGDRRFSLMLIGAGVVWSLSALAESPDSLTYSVGRVASWLIFPVLGLPDARVPHRAAQTRGRPAPVRRRHRGDRPAVHRFGAVRGGIPAVHAVGDLRARLPAERVLRARRRARDHARRRRAAARADRRGAADRRDRAARVAHARGRRRCGDA